MSTANRRRTERRSRMPSLRYPERRSGFDRRAPAGGALRRGYRNALLWYRRTPAAVATILALILALNAADLALTRRALNRGAVELNPVMARMFAVGDLPAAAFKVTVGLLVAAAIWRLRRYRRILEVSLAAVGLLGAIVAYHVAAAALGPA